MKKYFCIGFALLAVFLCVTVFETDTAKGDYFKIVQDMGYTDVEKAPFEVVEFTVPDEFNAVYKRYNNLLEEAGYSLEPYKGKKCKRYTYIIPSVNARANILVCEGKVVGGDISGITIDGVMIPIKKE